MDNALGQLQPSTLTKSAYRVLKDAILNLDLEPGTWLVEHQIAKQLGVSKTPVREALVRLEAEGFAVSPSGRGIHVVGLSLKTIRDLYGVRMILEPEIIRGATKGMSEAEIDLLDDINAQGRSAFERGDRDEYLRHNERFHMLFLERLDNQYLINIYRNIYENTYRVRAAVYKAEIELEDYSMTEKACRSHESIAEAIRQRDCELAAERMRGDVGFFFQHLDSPFVQRAMSHLEESE